jgi:lipopolysaccharide/colanic/teichoic acid biosynthesis glycosyltransferase
MNSNARYHFSIPLIIHPEEITSDAALVERLSAESLSAIIVDVENVSLRPMLARLYELSFVSPGYQFYDFYQIYEEVFDRVPLSLLQYDWFLKNVSSSASNFYDFFKRAIDIVGGVAMGLVTLVVLPFIFVAMRIEGPGSIFLTQKRIGQYGTRINAYKFRSMRFNNAASKDWVSEDGKNQENYVTKVGAFLRLTSLDEFPQFINIIRGEISLIGPRNDTEGLGVRLGEAIPYYNIRYIVKPGITGWAQINQQYEQGNISPQSIEETKTRLAYDFYYIKHRSLALDIVIALKTMKRMFFRVSSW